MVCTLRRLLHGGRLVQAPRPCRSQPICRASEEQPAWKAELAELNVAVRESAGEELPADEHDPAATYTLQKERVFLVGVQLKAALKDGNRFSGAPRRRPVQHVPTDPRPQALPTPVRRRNRPEPSAATPKGVFYTLGGDACSGRVPAGARASRN